MWVGQAPVAGKGTGLTAHFDQQFARANQVIGVQVAIGSNEHRFGTTVGSIHDCLLGDNVAVLFPIYTVAALLSMGNLEFLLLLAIGELRSLCHKGKVLASGTRGSIEPEFPFADRLLAHAKLFGKLPLCQAHVLAQAFD